MADTVLICRVCENSLDSPALATLSHMEVQVCQCSMCHHFMALLCWEESGETVIHQVALEFEYMSNSDFSKEEKNQYVGCMLMKHLADAGLLDGQVQYGVIQSKAEKPIMTPCALGPPIKAREFECPDCGELTCTPSEMEIRCGVTLIMHCEVCGNYLAFIHLPRDHDNVRVMPLDMGTMLDPEISEEARLEYFHRALAKYLQLNNLIWLYEARQRFMVASSSDEDLSLHGAKPGQLPDNQEVVEFLDSWDKAPHPKDLGMQE